MTEHPPGWYEHSGERRYWDGHHWTHSTSTPRPPDPQATPGQALAPYAPPSYPAPAPFIPPAPPFLPPAAPYTPPAAPFVPMTPGGPITVARKEPGLSVLASFLLPGLGSIINGDVGAGIALMLIYFVSAVFFLCAWAIVIGFVAIPVMLLVWIGGMIHAHQGAIDFNIRAGYPG